MQKEDFNPFDLSAPPKPKVIPLPEAEPFQAKPTVNRVSMGPLFHSRITRTLALVLGLVLSALIGYTAMNYYYNRQAEKSVTTEMLLIRIG